MVKLTPTIKSKLEIDLTKFPLSTFLFVLSVDLVRGWVLPLPANLLTVLINSEKLTKLTEVIYFILIHQYCRKDLSPICQLGDPSGG